MVTRPRMVLPLGMTVYSSTPIFSSTLALKVWPVFSVDDCSGAVVRTIITVPAGNTRDCATATPEVAITATAAPQAARRNCGRKFFCICPPDELVGLARLRVQDAYRKSNCFCDDNRRIS